MQVKHLEFNIVEVLHNYLQINHFQQFCFPNTKSIVGYYDDNIYIIVF